MFHISFNVPGELVEIFERVSLAAKIFHSVSGEMLLLRLNWGKINFVFYYQRKAARGNFQS